VSDDLGVDLDEVFGVIDAADVLIVRFQIVTLRLLVDFRTSSVDGSFIKPVPRATSVEDRFRSVKVLRPRFPVPEKLMSFYWPRSVETMVAAGVWDRLRERVVSLGRDAIADECDAALEELRREERREVDHAIRGGKEYQTLWQAQR
jgi:hypothetical protein